MHEEWKRNCVKISNTYNFDKFLVRETAYQRLVLQPRVVGSRRGGALSEAVYQKLFNDDHDPMSKVN